MLKFAWIVHVFLIAPTIGAVESYRVAGEPSIEEEWRWTELEGLGEFRFQYAAEGPDGAIWMASASELVRYDGLELERIDIGEDLVYLGLAVGKSGEVYVLTDRKLLSIRGSNWEVLMESPSGAGTFYRMCLANDGAVWVNGWRGLYRYFEGEMRTYRTSGFWSFSMLMDQEGMLWVGAANLEQVLVYDATQLNGDSLPLLYRFDPPGENSVSRLQMDLKGRVWNAVPDEQGRCYYYEDYERKIAGSGLEGPFMQSLTLESKSAFGIAVTTSGRMWLCVQRGLAEIVDGEARPFDNGTLLPTGMPSICALSKDRLLIGGRESKTYLIDLSTRKWLTYRNLNYQCEDEEGRSWFLEHDGRVVSHSAENGDWLAYGVEDQLPERPNRIQLSKDGTLWVSGKHGDSAALSYLKGEKWIRKSFPDLGTIFSHLAVEEDEDGTMVFGVGTPQLLLDGRSGGAVEARRVNGEEWEFKSIAPPVYPARPAVIVSRAPAEHWYGGSGLRRRARNEGGALELVEPINSNRWTDDLAVDGGGNLWAAVWGKGVLKFDGREWHAFGESSGLANNQVIALLTSEAGSNAWVARVGGLSRFDGEVWTNWDLPFPQPFGREEVTLRNGSDGALWINSAYRSWLLEGMLDEGQAEKFSASRYRPSELAPQTRWLEFQKELPEGSPILATWTGVDAWSETPGDALQYSWRIGGGEWSPFSRDTSYVFSGIGSGAHRLEVRARDSDWNVDTTPATLEIVVIPPLWKRAWFIMLMVTMCGVIVFLLERLFRARVRAALAMEEFKLDFFANISHELRNPLSVILGPLESLIREEEGLKKRQRLSLVLRSARKMQGLVDQLLQFRKAELGKANFRPSPGELIGFVGEAIELQKPLIAEKKLELKFESSESHFVCGFDAEKLQKIVDNLLSNAIKYSDVGGRTLVSVNIDTKDGLKELRLVVEDRGKGIPAHEIGHVLKPFYRARKSRDANAGFGLGLPLVNSLAQVCGGEVNLESPIVKGGGGTRVVVRMPLSAERSERLVTEDLLDERVEGEAPRLSGRTKLLLVEDNADLRQFMKEEFSKRFKVLDAGNGRIGLEMALKENPELVITDVMMPEMNGIELCRRLRSQPETSHVPIIILTAKSSVDQTVEGVEAGADVYFAKPVNMLKLQAQVDNLLELRERMKRRFSEQLVVEPTELTIVSADQEFLRKAIKLVEDNMHDADFGLEDFGRQMGLGRTALHRKLKALTGEAPGAFIRSMRLKRAAQLLDSKNVTIARVLECIGILDQSYFSRTFKKEFGVSPSKYGKTDEEGGG